MKNILIFFFVLLFSITAISQNQEIKPPRPGPAPKIDFGKHESFKLKNGLKVLLVENHKLPRVSFYLIFNRPPIMQGNQNGYIEAAGKLIGIRTKSMSKEQIDEKLNYFDAKLRVFPGGVFAATLKNHTEQLLKIVSDIAMNSVFTQNDLNVVKIGMESKLKRQQNNPRAILNIVSDAVNYGKDFPYGVHPTEASIDSITLQKCKEYYSLILGRILPTLLSLVI